ncbi:MAG: hypothetical protein HW406_1004 [Candidatus Brocadiaceae bacterium]|nr:hypothetical protein [Candidatus Brocadiaceae bacterium]
MFLNLCVAILATKDAVETGFKPVFTKNVLRVLLA